MTRPEFLARLGQTFELVDDDRTVELVLTEVTEPRRTNGQQTFEITFASRFTGGTARPIEQGTYLVGADGSPPAPIFLVPLRNTPDGTELLAVFTQLEPEDEME